MPRESVYEVLHALRPHLSPPGLTVVQVAQVENSEEQVAKVEILVQGLEGRGTPSAALRNTERWM